MDSLNKKSKITPIIQNQAQKSESPLQNEAFLKISESISSIELKLADLAVTLNNSIKDLKGRLVDIMTGISIDIDKKIVKKGSDPSKSSKIFRSRN